MRNIILKWALRILKRRLFIMEVALWGEHLRKTDKSKLHTYRTTIYWLEDIVKS